jgi:hypothetical protein
MSRLPAYLYARWRKEDLASTTGPEADSRKTDKPNADSRDASLAARVFSLIPPGIFERTDTTESAEAAESTGHEEAAPTDKPSDAPAIGRNVHPIGITDLSRLSIDNDGRLYWDGKPVEVRRRILMSRAQIVGVSVIGTFVAIGAIGAAIQGSAAVRDWSCRLGWTNSYCGLPDAPPARPAHDIPA